MPKYRDFVYSQIDSGIRIYKYDHHRWVSSVTVPRKIEGLLVTEIGDRAFKKCTILEKISLPDSLQTIGNNAFPRDAIIVRYKTSTQENSTPLLEKIIALKKSGVISEEIVKELEKVEHILKLDIEKLVREIISDVESIIKIQDTPTLESRLIDLLNSVSYNVQISKKNFYAETISPLEAHIKNNVKILAQSRSENESE